MPTLYVTAPTDAAEELASALVEQRLAACVNRVDCRSTYRWDGDVVTDDEEILLVKTNEAVVADAVARIEAEHPHDVPCVERFDEDGVLPDYAEWIDDSVDAA